MPCPACRWPTSTGAAFCGHCGARLVPGSCRRCSTPVAAGEAYCARCGAQAGAAAGTTPERLAAFMHAASSAGRTTDRAPGNGADAPRKAPSRNAARRWPPLLAATLALVVLVGAAMRYLDDEASPAGSELAHTTPPMPITPAPIADSPRPVALDPEPDTPAPKASEIAEAAVAAPPPEPVVTVAPPSAPPRRAAPVRPAATAPPARRTAVEPVPVPARTATTAVAPPPARAARSEPARGESAPSWQLALRRELAGCEPEPLLPRTLCREKARWKYCNPDRWDRVAECKVGNRPGTRAGREPW